MKWEEMLGGGGGAAQFPFPRALGGRPRSKPPEVGRVAGNHPPHSLLP